MATSLLDFMREGTPEPSLRVLIYSYFNRQGRLDNNVPAAMKQADDFIKALESEEVKSYEPLGQPSPPLGKNIKKKVPKRGSGRNRTPRRGEYYDDENIYNSPSIRQSIEEDRK